MAHAFKDNTGQAWDMSINVSTVRRVKNLLGVDLLAVLDRPAMLGELAADTLLFVDVLYAVAKPQADAAGITDEQFGAALAGDVIETATTAFLEALVDFFPGSKRDTLRRVLDRSTEAMKRAESQLATALTDGSIDKAIDDALATLIAGKTSTQSPAVSASTPAA